MRLTRSFVPAALAASLLLATSAAAQETETPSSRPSPSPGAPTPPVSAPQDAAPTSATAADRSVGEAAVRNQCGADRARFCREGGGAGGVACLTDHFSKLSPDCQSAVHALGEVKGARSGSGG